MIPVILESPYAGKGETESERRCRTAINVAYARAAMRDCLLRGEAPFASHLLYTQEGVLRDEVPALRALGIEAGFVWRGLAKKTVVYTDLGITAEMQAGINNALLHGHEVAYRTLEGWS